MLRKQLEIICSSLSLREYLAVVMSEASYDLQQHNFNRMERSSSSGRPAGEAGDGVQITLLQLQEGTGLQALLGLGALQSWGQNSGKLQALPLVAENCQRKKNQLAKQTVSSFPLPVIFFFFLISLNNNKNKAWHFSNTHVSKTVHLGC